MSHWLKLFFDELVIKYCAQVGGAPYTWDAFYKWGNTVFFCVNWNQKLRCVGSVIMNISVWIWRKCEFCKCVFTPILPPLAVAAASFPSLLLGNPLETTLNGFWEPQNAYHLDTCSKLLPPLSKPLSFPLPRITIYYNVTFLVKSRWQICNKKIDA